MFYVESNKCFLVHTVKGSHSEKRSEQLNPFLAAQNPEIKILNIIIFYLFF